MSGAGESLCGFRPFCFLSRDINHTKDSFGRCDALQNISMVFVLAAVRCSKAETRHTPNSAVQGIVRKCRTATGAAALPYPAGTIQPYLASR